MKDCQVHIRQSNILRKESGRKLMFHRLIVEDNLARKYGQNPLSVSLSVGI